MSEPLEIIYEDAWLVAVNKPSGMLVHRGWARDGDIAVDVLHKQLGKHVWPLHRLDRATSGALLFALDVETTRTLSHEFEHGRVGKRYLALVRGIPPEALLIDHSLRRVDSDSPERLPAQTQIRRLGTFERYALVEATPLTGRTHQIRRHLKHISHPIIGDVRYGKGDHNRVFRERFGLHRLALHASELHVPHPTLGEVIVRARLPADLAGPLEAIGLQASCPTPDDHSPT